MHDGEPCRVDLRVHLHHCYFKTFYQTKSFFMKESEANIHRNKQIHRHQVIKSAKSHQSHYLGGRLVLNLNYSRCILIRTDCEIRAIKS